MQWDFFNFFFISNPGWNSAGSSCAVEQHVNICLGNSCGSRKDAARLQYFAKNSRCSSLGWVRGSSRPQGTARMPDWDKDKMAGACLRLRCLAFILHRDTVSLALLKAQNTKKPHLTAAPATEKLRCTRGRTLTARVYSFVFVGVNTQHIFDWGRARGIQSHCLQVSMNKQCLVTAVPPYRKWAQSCNSHWTAASGQKNITVKKKGGGRRGMIPLHFISQSALKIEICRQLPAAHLDLGK